MIQKKSLFILLLVLFITPLFYGCDKIDSLKVKLGLKNNDFEYIKEGKIKKIIIQNTRDHGFRFVVTDQKAIEELYDILSTAKEVDTKSALEPDYTFEMQEDINKVYKFNYVAGLDKDDAGNLYSEDKVYLVSKRIDNDIIKNFWNIRKPNDFNEVYYGTILDQVEKYAKEQEGKSIGINIYDDVEAAKFMLSADLEDFESSLKDKVSNAELMDAPKNGEVSDDKYDVIMTVKTVGYKTFLYKCQVTFYDKTKKSEKNYYIQVSDNYEDGRWNTKVYTDKDKPDSF